MILRVDQDRLHMVLINPSSLRPAKARVHLRESYRMAIDRGVERGFAVPLNEHDGRQVFDIELASGEGTMIDLVPSRR